MASHLQHHCAHSRHMTGVSTAATGLSHQRVCLGESITYFLILRNETQEKRVSRKGMVCHMIKKGQKVPKRHLNSVYWEHCRQDLRSQVTFSVRGEKCQPRNKKQELPHISPSARSRYAQGISSWSRTQTSTEESRTRTQTRQEGSTCLALTVFSW